MKPIYIVYDEVTRYPPMDNPAALQAAIKFVDSLTDRCNGKHPVHHMTDARVWVHKNELRQLRHIAGIGASKVKNKNRRMRVETVRSYLAKAEDKLAERAGLLASRALGAEKRPKIDETLDTVDWKFQYELYSQRYGVFRRDPLP